MKLDLELYAELTVEVEDPSDEEEVAQAVAAAIGHTGLRSWEIVSRAPAAEEATSG